MKKKNNTAYIYMPKSSRKKYMRKKKGGFTIKKEVKRERISSKPTKVRKVNLKPLRKKLTRKQINVEKKTGKLRKLWNRLRGKKEEAPEYTTNNPLFIPSSPGSKIYYKEGQHQNPNEPLYAQLNPSSSFKVPSRHHSYMTIKPSSSEHIYEKIDSSSSIPAPKNLPLSIPTPRRRISTPEGPFNRLERPVVYRPLKPKQQSKNRKGMVEIPFQEDVNVDSSFIGRKGISFG